MAELMTFEELEIRLGVTFVPGSAEQLQMEAWLADLTDEIVALAAPYVDLSNATSATTNGGIKRIMATVLGRTSANPNGLTGENMGDYGWQANNAGTPWFMSDAEWRMVRRILGVPVLGQVNFNVYAPMYREWEEIAE